MCDEAYAAGMVDGDGTIGLTIIANGRGNVRAKVAVYNQNMDMLAWFEVRWGGYVRNSGVGSAYWEPEDRVAFLQAIRPYLVGKKLQAALVLEFLAMPKNRHGVRLTDEQVSLRTDMAKAVQALNKKPSDTYWREHATITVAEAARRRAVWATRKAGEY